jgi:hypothetical protein
MTFGSPSLLRKRRYCAPRYVWLRSKVEAPIRSAVAARLTTWRVPRASTLSPLMRLSGQSPSHDAKCSSFRRDGDQPGKPMSHCGGGFWSAELAAQASYTRRGTVACGARGSALRIAATAAVLSSALTFTNRNDGDTEEEGTRKKPQSVRDSVNRHDVQNSCRTQMHSQP